jgi:xylan 1,4-beta-xylosidase
VTQEPRPVISGFHPDPSVVRSGDDFYLVTSSFEYFPAVPLFHSTNLTEWTQVGHVLNRGSQVDVAHAQPSGGIYAPTIRQHSGRFWMITTNVSDGRGQILVSATDPAGPWSDPVRIPDVEGIDPDLAWDDAGRLLVTYAQFGTATSTSASTSAPAATSTSAFTSVIRQVEVDPSTGDVRGKPVELWQGTGHQFPEGPHLYRANGYWYLLLAEGGTERGHSVVIARGPTPQGPFEANPAGPILTRRGKGGSLQNTGHADLVQRADGSWAIVFLGVRVRGVSPGFHGLGRETFAAEVHWQNDWPVVGDLLEPSTTTASTVVDVVTDFSGRLGSEWVASGPGAAAPIAAVGDGSLLLNSSDYHDVFLGRRQEHLYADATVSIEAGSGRGALVLRLDPAHEYAVEVSSTSVAAVSQVGAVRAVVVEKKRTASWPQSTPGATNLAVYVAVIPVTSTSGAPECVTLGYVENGVRVELARLDGRYLSTEVAGGFTGRLFGVVSASGNPAFSHFRYRGSDDPAALASASV